MAKLSSVVVSTALALCGSLSFVAVSGAQPAQAPAWVTACNADVQKLCKDLAAKGEDVRECLYTHEKDLSPACNEAFVAKYRVMKVCKDDFEKVCAGAAIPACVKEKQDQLSEKCRSALLKGSRQHKAETAAAAKAEPGPAKAEAQTAAAPAEAKPKSKTKSKKPKKPAAAE